MGACARVLRQMCIFELNSMAVTLLCTLKSFAMQCLASSNCCNNKCNSLQLAGL